MARTCEAKACAGRPIASGPNQPTAGQNLRTERGAITQCAARLAISPMPRSLAMAAHSLSSSRRHWWLLHAVQARISDWTRSGCRRATSWAMAPPIDAPITWARSTPAASRTATASSAISSSG